MIDKIKESWTEILRVLKLEYDLSDVSFKTWILPLKPFSVENDTLKVLVPEELEGLNIIQKKYYLPLKVTIEEVTSLPLDIDFILPPDIDEGKHSPFNISVEPRNELFEEANLNPVYTFDSFVVGENNNLAHAASLAVAESPAKIYNPLFIYGGVGLGKTHLMQSIAHFILERNPKTKVLYVTSEEFTNELIDSIRNENQSANMAFRKKYRNIDVLLIDDIQFIIGKDSTQQEFFHTFNSLREAKKQIIISSDKPPKDFETLEERFRSRFASGLTVDIQPPTYETRMAILKKKEETEGITIDNTVLQYVANNINSNIRELEGALTQIIAHSKLSKRVIDVEYAETILKDIIFPEENKEISPSYIIETVAEHFNVSTSDLSSKKKNKEIVFPRQIAMYLCRLLTDVSQDSIGGLLGGRDHTTIIYGVEKIQKEIEKNEDTKKIVNILKKKIVPN